MRKAYPHIFATKQLNQIIMNRVYLITLLLSILPILSFSQEIPSRPISKLSAGKMHTPKAQPKADNSYVSWGYCINDIQYSIGIGEEATISAAILIKKEDMKAFKNADIVGIRIGLSAQSNNISVFLKAGNADNLSFDLPDIVKKSVGNKGNGFHDIMFDAPQNPQEEYIIVGYTATGTNNIGFDGGTVYSDACYLNIDNTWGTVYNNAVKNNWGSLCIQLLLSGSELPEREMQLDEITTKNVEQNKPFILSGVVSNKTTTEVNSYEISYSFNNGEMKTQTIETSLQGMEYETFEIEVDEPLTKTGNNTAVVSITSVNGEEDSDTQNNTILQAINCIEEGCYFKRVMVLEESTSVNCGYCPKGVVVMKTLKEMYPEQFIGIAIHSPAMGNDPMAVYDYDESINYLYQEDGLPNSILNRMSEYSGDPILMTKYFDDVLKYNELSEGLVKITETDGISEDNTIKVKAITKFTRNNSNAYYKIAFIVVENNVESDTGQLNYFSGGAQMGGWENLPEMVFQPFEDVARGIWDFEGIEGSVPSEVIKKQEYEFEYELSLDEKKAIIQKAENAEIVALLLNGYTGEIINADKVSLKGTSNIKDTDKQPITLYDDNGTIKAAGDFDSMEVYNLNGMMLNNRNLEKGIYIVKVTTGKETTIQKVYIR